MPLPTFDPVRRGVTLLELLIVLTVMGVATALVAPALVRPAGPPIDAERDIMAKGRRHAVRRGEPLRVNLWPDGRWLLTSQRDGSLVDSGTVRDSLSPADLLLDALGSCVPADSRSRAQAFDPLSCHDVEQGANR